MELVLHENIVQSSSKGKLPSKEKAVVTQFMVNKRLSSDTSRKKLSCSLLKLLNKTDLNELIVGEYDTLD
jgi:hypothetical protein